MQSFTLSVVFFLMFGTWSAHGLHSQFVSTESNSSVQSQPWVEAKRRGLPIASSSSAKPDGRKWWVESYKGRDPLQDDAKILFNLDKPIIQNLEDAWHNKMSIGAPIFVTRHVDFHKPLPPFNYMFPYDDTDQKQVFDQGILQPYVSYHLVQDMKECCRSGSGRFVDVGSTYGWYSLLASSLGCRVESFESVPWASALRDYNVKVLNTHLMRENIKLHHPQLVSNTSNVTSTLAIPLRENAKACEQGAQCFSATTTTIDNEINWEMDDSAMACGMNINAQGYEPDVIDGGKQFIEKYRPKIIALDISPSKTKQIGRNNNDHINMLDTLTGQFSYESYLLKLEAVKTYNQDVMKGSMAGKKMKAKGSQMVTACGQQCMIYMKSQKD